MATIIELKQLFAQALKDHPFITASGFLSEFEYHKDKPKQVIFDRDRTDLQNGFADFIICYEFIEKLSLVERSAFDQRTSYEWKHVVEKATGEYVSNGAFILAALAHGCTVEATGTVNVKLRFP